jgi:trk/ktr system potassium uptake protein
VHIIVVGCGRVGSTLAFELVGAGHSVAVVDKRRESLDRLGADFSGSTIVGIGFDRDVLTSAGIERADAVAAVTSGDNSNILIARVARENFGIERVVARIYDPRRAAVYQRLGIDTVATVAWTTEQIVRRLAPRADVVEWVDPTAGVSLVERRIGGVTAGRRYSEIEETAHLRVVAVCRLGATELPAPGLVAQEDDLVFLAVRSDRLALLDQALASPAHH